MFNGMLGDEVFPKDEVMSRRTGIGFSIPFNFDRVLQSGVCPLVVPFCRLSPAYDL